MNTYNTVSLKKLNGIKKILEPLNLSKEDLEKLAYNTILYYPEFRPELWNSDEKITKTHNCYAYFLNNINKKIAELCEDDDKRNCNGYKPQPGLYAGFKEITDKKNYTCKNMTKRILADNPGIYVSNKPYCKAGHYMGVVAIDPGKTYHFYRKDNNGRWSHKNGQMDAKDFDAEGNKMIDLHKAARHYKKTNADDDLNYKKICTPFCIPKYTKKNMSFYSRDSLVNKLKATGRRKNLKKHLNRRKTKRSQITYRRNN